MHSHQESFQRLVEIVEELREKCPWDRKQTKESLRHLTIEETYELADAIRLAAAGRSTLAPEAAQVLLHAATHPRNVGLDLTDRERQVLPLLVKGLNNGEIARKMMISQSTVRFHVSNILSKLGAHSRTEAAALAIKYNLVS